MSRPAAGGKREPAADSGGLRRRAESHIARRKKSGAVPQRTIAESARLVHELEVHKIELEMQNAELRDARVELEASLDRYTDLYDLAPTGYFSLDESGLILEANLTGAAKFGARRPVLVGRRFQRYVLPESVPTFTAFVALTFERPQRQSCEIPLRSESGDVFWADVHATAATSMRGGQRWCRVVVSDITAVKRAEQAQSNVDQLAARNRELDGEIAQRRKAEDALIEAHRQQAWMLEESRRAQAQLRRLSHGMLHAQENERRRISRELHDEVGQAVLAVNIHLEMLEREMRGASASARKRVAKARRLLHDFAEVVHRFAMELRPTVLDDLGLVSALRSFTKDFALRTGIDVRFTPGGGAERLSGTKTTVLYRIAQEALTNVGKHARATRVDVELGDADDVVTLVIADDGKSFDVQQTMDATRHRRLGLLGMRERAEMVGGRFTVESAPGRGTTVRVEIPYAEGRAAVAASAKRPRPATP